MTEFKPLSLDDLGIIPNDEPILTDADRKHISDIANCGAQVRIPDGCGGSYIGHYHCGYWRECPQCYDHRVQKKFVDRMLRIEAEYGDQLTIVSRSSSDADNYIRHLRRINVQYWRIPVANDMAIVISGLVDVQSDLDIYDLNMDMLAMTPQGTRYSGSLGSKRAVSKESDERKLSVQSIGIQTSLDPAEDQLAWNLAVEKTDWLSPEFYEDEIAWAIYKQVEEYKKQVKDLGGRILREQKQQITVFFNTFSEGWTKGIKKPRQDEDIVDYAYECLGMEFLDTT